MRMECSGVETTSGRCRSSGRRRSSRPPDSSGFAVGSIRSTTPPCIPSDTSSWSGLPRTSESVRTRSRESRAEFRYATFAAGVTEIKDLRPGMALEGVVTNVANFGAFVDIGVHQDGLVHVSQLADKFVKDAKEVVKVGQIVTVRVLEVNENLKRISLSMKKSGEQPGRGQSGNLVQTGPH